MADKTIPDFPDGGAIADSDPFESVQSLASVKQTATKIAAYVTLKLGVVTNIKHSAAEVDTSYRYSQPVAGATVTIAAGVGRAVLDPAGTLATLTVQLPSSPVDGQIASISSTQIITALTVTAPGGASVAGALSALAVGGRFTMIYRATNTTWYPA